MMKPRTLIRLLSLAALVASGLWGTLAVVHAAPSGPDVEPGAPVIHGGPAAKRVADTTGAAAKDAPGADAAQSRNAARSRMRECGHQWSSMKKNGAAGSMTWKDFSQGCLAKQ